MPYHLSTLLGSRAISTESFMTRKDAEKEAEQRELEAAEYNLKLLDQEAERLRSSVLDLDYDDCVPRLGRPLRHSLSYRVDRCSNSLLCRACLEAGFDQAESWPRRGTDWGVFDREAQIEVLRCDETQVFENDEHAAAFVVLAAQNPGTPTAVRRECQMALGEIIFCNSMGFEAWRDVYGGVGRWKEILGFKDESEDVPCECRGSGFLVMNEERYESEGALGEIQACDCGIFKTDEDAFEAARAAGYIVTVEGLILSEPCRKRALRRWGG